MLKIEITAASVDELSDKLLALGHRLAVDVAAPPASEKPATKPKATKPKATEGNEPAPTADAPSATSSSAPDTPTAEPAQSPSEAPATLDWAKDVAPVVTGYVKSKGREFVAEVLTEFGVERASQLPEDRWQELLDTLADRA